MGEIIRTWRDQAENGPDPQGREEITCLQNGPSCSGEVEYRQPLSGTGIAYPRCEHHWQLRLDEQDRIERTYPRQQPADFDPSYAGERWEED